MKYILVLEWINKCEQFIQDYQSQHNWNEEQCFYVMWSGITSTKYLNLTLFENYIEIAHKLTSDTKNFVRHKMSENPAFTMEILLACPEWKCECECYSSIYMNINDILDHPELKWDWSHVSHNPSVTMEIVLSNIIKPWNWVRLSRHPNITMSDIESHMNLPWIWKWYGVGQNPNLTMAMIETHPDMDWDWNGISKRMKLTVDLLRQYADKPWDFVKFCQVNPSITLELLCATPDLPWNYYWLSSNPSLTMDILLALPDKDWNWRSVSFNKGITMSDIECHMDLPWDWEYVSKNPNIRIYDIEKHLDKTWVLSCFFSEIFNPDEYIDRWLCKYSVLSIHDEDYDRGEECLDYDNVVDLVIQNVYCISYILGYL